MDAISTIMTALALGIASGLQQTTTQAVRDAYTGLKVLIERKYASVSLDVWETDPKSKARRGVVEEDLRKTQAAEDPELLHQAQALLQEAKTNGADVGRVIGVSLQEIEAASISLDSIIAQGSGAASGVEIKDAKVAGDITITNVQAGQVDDQRQRLSPDKASSSPPAAILLLAANPQGTDSLRLDKEVRAIDRALRTAEMREQFELHHHWAVQTRDLPNLFTRYQPVIVHFCGHGDTSGELILDSDADVPTPVAVDALAGFFSILPFKIRCVVLNACYSEKQAQAIAPYVDCVVGTDGAIGDNAAIAFAETFYGALGSGQSVQTAFDMGRSTVEMEGMSRQYAAKLLSTGSRPSALRFVRRDADSPKG